MGELGNHGMHRKAKLVNGNDVHSNVVEPCTKKLHGESTVLKIVKKADRSVPEQDFNLI